MIRIVHLSKAYFGHKVVDNLSLEIKEGTIFGFLGPNGAGKTTAIKMIVGLTKTDEGKIRIGGKDLSALANREKIGFMPEDPYFYEHLSALEFLSFMRSLFRKQSSTPKNLKSGLISKQIPNQKSKKQKGLQTLEQLNTLISIVGLAEVGKKKIKNFSKGMKQRLGLAQALVNDPDYLFLDEPLDGLDPIGRLEFKRIFLDLKKQGKTIFFNSHILSDVEEICDTIGIINKGHLIYSGAIKPFCGSTGLEKKFVEVIQNE